MTDFKEIYPIRKCDFELNNGLVVIHFVKEKLTFIEKLFFKKDSEKPYKIDLDEIGSFIWHLCDGKKNVGQIIAIAEEKFENKINPANERVELFIKQMHKNKLVNLFEKR